MPLLSVRQPAPHGDVAATLRNTLAPLVEPGHLHDLLPLMGGGALEFDGDIPLTLWRIRRGATLLHEGTSTLAVFVVRSGSFKSIKTLEDGYEQVVSFAHPGEILGFEALHCGRQPTSIVALEDATACALPMHGGRLVVTGATALAEALQFALSRQLARAAGQAEMMAAVASDVRLARFLLWMSARMEEAGQSPRRLLLRMCRRDIASLLGVAHETVSRSFTTLADAGLLTVQNREVDILDLPALRGVARSTRGGAEDCSRRRAPLARVHPSDLSRTWFPQEAMLAAAA